MFAEEVVFVKTVRPAVAEDEVVFVKAVRDEEAPEAKRRRQVVEECAVCLEEAVLPFRLERCVCVSCRACLERACRVGAESGMAEVPCPRCRTALSPEDVRSLDLTAARIVERFARDRAVNVRVARGEIARCPRPDCSGSARPRAKRLDCPECARASCVDCGGPWHEPPLECAQTVGAAETAATLEALGSSLRVCERCGDGIVKASGCDKVACRCGFRFCWACGARDAACPCNPGHAFLNNSHDLDAYHRLSTALATNARVERRLEDGATFADLDDDELRAFIRARRGAEPSTMLAHFMRGAYAPLLVQEAKRLESRPVASIGPEPAGYRAFLVAKKTQKRQRPNAIFRADLAIRARHHHPHHRHHRHFGGFPNNWLADVLPDDTILSVDPPR
ncbi:hypothetical protein CTAYLR_001045 [Chrysophaeum taylorii]|uniref:RBR-type E3 ubiquitin transferase n=1 Tax=Chrysophaeum taylorii TaxID=2483200 RepID=A0AAD7UH43_9STRA|nr:hypothetical protein CTAYLR_001045 [Chrysophaeum taylorii]